MKRKASTAGDNKKAKKPAIKRANASPNLLRSPNTVHGGPEKKNFDLAQTVNIPLTGTSGQSTLLTQLAQGTASNTRLGRKVHLVSFDMRWYINSFATSTGGAIYRIKIIYDKQANGAAPAATDVLTVDSITAANNLDNSDRFITIADEFTEPTSQQDKQVVGGRIFRKMDLEQIWLGGGAGGTIASIITGSLYLFAWASNGTAAVTPAALVMYTRVRFEDN